ncbi:MAG TPA: NADH-quinone oxidoreductase subunit NuoN [Kineosporiaceae bacterium]|nr:NADH-quinone oxidoreductase subunit NuoN [Kineosporiaceae bacterium]
MSAFQAAGGFIAPTVDYAAVSPMLIVFGAALVAVLVEAFVPRAYRFTTQVGVALVGVVAALCAVAALAYRNEPLQTAGVRAAGRAFAGAVVVDGVTLFLQGSVLGLSVLAVLTMAERAVESGGAFTAQAAAVPGSPAEERSIRAGLVTSEVFPLLLFSVGGMLLFPAANDLLTMFVALEVLSLPLYLMCGLARRRRLLSQEAALKYFLLGAFSSAFFLFGAAMLYGFAGSVQLTDIAAAIAGSGDRAAVINQDGLLLLGAGLVLIGLLFKVSAAPFHSWTPDVYQGAPTPVTGFMAACTKVAAFGALLRVAYVALPSARWDWQPVLWGIAILTMAVGSVIAIVQTDVKRMLAYSSIAHAGFLLTGIIAMDKQGIGAVLFYLLAYGFATIGAFAVVTLVRDAGPEGVVGGEATHLSQWAGLGRRHPWIAGIFTLFLLAFAGIPLTSGFMGKYAVFSAAVHGGAWILALVGVLASAIAAFFYVRVIVLMYFSEPAEASSAAVVALPGTATTFAVVVAALVTVLLGVVPSPVLDLAGQASAFLP